METLFKLNYPSIYKHCVLVKDAEDRVHPVIVLPSGAVMPLAILTSLPKKGGCSLSKKIELLNWLKTSEPLPLPWEARVVKPTHIKCVESFKWWDRSEQKEEMAAAQWRSINYFRHASDLRSVAALCRHAKRVRRKGTSDYGWAVVLGGTVYYIKGFNAPSAEGGLPKLVKKEVLAALKISIIQPLPVGFESTNFSTVDFHSIRFNTKEW